jgi:hypothetical protein
MGSSIWLLRLLTARDSECAVAKRSRSEAEGLSHEFRPLTRMPGPIRTDPRAS